MAKFAELCTDARPLFLVEAQDGLDTGIKGPEPVYLWVSSAVEPEKDISWGGSLELTFSAVCTQ